MSKGKYRNKLICLMIVLAVIFCMCMSASAITQDIAIPAAQSWTNKYNAGTHQAGYDSASAECESVYPISGIDLFHTIQCRAVNSSGTVISANSSVKLNEGDGETPILLKQGMQGNIQVFFQFRGNSSSAARAVVAYSATYM